MSDDLLKRVSQAIYDNCGMVDYRCEQVAQKVIEALSLTVTGGVITGSLHE